ncbi:MAG: hypothetical protein R6X02_00415 [Enhygromyxa sp.]
MRLLRVPVALLLTLSLPGVALAQVPPPPKAPAQPKAEPEPEPEPELSEAEKAEKAKHLYIEAEGLAAEDRWAEAVPLYEEAYYLVPGKHGFAHKVGIATWKIDDCDKTKEYLTHFVTYADPEKFEEKIAEAQAILDEIEERQCATPEPEPEPEPAPVATENPLDDDDPLSEGGGATTDTGPKQKKGLLIGGAALIVLGVGGIGAGAAGAAMASGAGKQLDDLSSANTPTGYPAGDYACRTGECPPDLESKLQTGKVIGALGFAAGGALLVTGVALIAIHASKKKKAGGGASAKGSSPVQLTAAGPMLVPGGGGAMAGIRF